MFARQALVILFDNQRVRFLFVVFVWRIELLLEVFGLSFWLFATLSQRKRLEGTVNSGTTTFGLTATFTCDVLKLESQLVQALFCCRSMRYMVQMSVFSR